MKLHRIRKLGKYQNTDTKQVVNVFKGQDSAGCTILFYLFRGKRQIITAYEFYAVHKWTKINELADAFVTGALKGIYKANQCTDLNDVNIAIDRVKQLTIQIDCKKSVYRRLLSLEKRKIQLAQKSK